MVLVVSVNTLPVSVSMAITTYLRIIPFASLNSGDSHMSDIELEVMDVTDRFLGGALGATEERAYT